MKFSKYIKELAEISIPIILGNLGFIFIGVGDVIVAGRHSTQTLAAVSIATAVLNCIAMIGIGIISAVAPIISNKRGQGRSPEKFFFPTIKFALIMGVLISALMFAFVPIVDYMGYSPELSKLIKTYSFITAFSIFGAYIHCACKEFLQSFEIVVFPNILTVFSVFLNLGLNIIFVFGYWGLPEMGTAGLALASLLVRYFMGITLFIYAILKLKPQKHTNTIYYKSLLKVGFPIATAILVEFVAFNIIPIVMGRVSELYAAAQNILCTLLTIPFMVALAVSNAVAVKVGYSNGAGNFLDLRRFAISGILMAESFMVISVFLLLFFPHLIIGMFTKDAALLTVTLPILHLMAIYQIFDALQVSLAGIFKGLKDTGIVLMGNFIGYWLISIPLGTLLAFKYNMNIAGYWYGIATGGLVLNLILLTKLFRKYKTWKKLTTN